MATRVSRPAEQRAVSEFLATAALEPAALVIEGEAGIGKTTVWLDGLERARELGFRVPLWADRARAELSRSDTGRRRKVGLTASEQRIAELAASGVTNRDMAATLFVSPKTVEANLTRIYRKLNIHSCAELGRIMRRGDS
jgi:DNA-binding CsgD family transcriptional regulator